MAISSFVLEHPTAEPGQAASHFAAKLSVETDPFDVYADFAAGCEDFKLVDTRSPEAFANAHLPGAISLPHRLINEESTASLGKDKVIVVYCWGPACNAGAKGALRFSSLGFQVKEMIGGFEYWVREGFPIEGTKTTNPDLVGVAVVT
jgi:rhodanese-related sulfurtransferase